MAEQDQQTPKGQEAEPVIEVDLDETDPGKAVTRTVTRGSVAADGEGKDAGSDVDQWAERSRAVNKRLGRMARNYEQRLADAEARHQREISSLRQDMDKLRTERRDGPVAGADADHERKMKELADKLAAAQERGDSAEISRLTVEITRTDGAYWAAKTAAQMGTQAQPRQDQQPAAAPPQQRTGPTAAGSRFITANEDWWEDPEFSAEKQYANEVFARLTREEGYDAQDDATFDEVVAALNKKFRDLKAQKGARRQRRAETQETDEEPAARRGTVGAIQDRGQPGQSVRARRTLTQSDIQTMRGAGLDPNNNQHVLAFLREAQAYDAA